MLLPLRLATALLAALLLFTDEAMPASAPARPDPLPAVGEDVDNVVITGRRPEGVSLQKFMLDFIAEVGDPTSDDNGYARWRNRVCVEVRNLNDINAAQYVADRISTIALEVGLKPGAPGCRPNLHIIFSTDGRALASSLVKTQRNVFRPFGGAGGTTQGLRALEEFATSDAPVRWWQITMVVDPMGQIAIRVPNMMDGPTVVQGSNSRITNSVSDELWGNYVIVDINKLANVSWPQLTDYLAMVSLAQINPQRSPSSYSSILNLFDNPASASGLTEMDRTYLHALYKMDTRRMPQLQRSLLANTMVLEQDKLAKQE